MPASAADFDTLLSESVTDNGVFNGERGIFYADVIENGTMLVTASAIDDMFVISLFGSDNEPADTLILKLRDKLTLSVSKSEDFYISADKKYYRIVNDAFTLCKKPDSGFTQLAVYSRNKIILSNNPDIYELINKLKEQRISRLPSAALPDTDSADLLRLIKACADIQSYDASDHDIDALMRGMLYTHRNFRLLTPVPPLSADASGGLHICSEDYIRSAAHNAFRLDALHPAVNMLTHIGYCVNNSFYYYTGGYSKYFATDVKDILKAFPLSDGELYIVFSDSYTEGGGAPSAEYSTARAAKDNEGWYLTAIHMNGDFSDLPEMIRLTGVMETSDSHTGLILPIIIILLLISAAIGFAVYFFKLGTR